MEKVNRWLSRAYQWVVYSSTNANKLSMTIRGLQGFVPSVIVFLTLVNIPLSEQALTQLIEGFAVFVAAVGSAVSAGITLVGLVRKVLKTVDGTNDVVLGFEDDVEAEDRY